jgi:hypothetical protein
MTFLYHAAALISEATRFTTILGAVTLCYNIFLYSVEYLDIAFSHYVYFQLPGNFKNQGIMSDKDSSSVQNMVQSQPRREPKIILQRAENIFAALKGSLVRVFMFVHLEHIAINMYIQKNIFREHFATKLFFSSFVLLNCLKFLLCAITLYLEHIVIRNLIPYICCINYIIDVGIYIF